MATPNYTLYQGGSGASGAGRTPTNGGTGGGSYPSAYGVPRGGRWSGDYSYTTWEGSGTDFGENGMPGSVTQAKGDWNNVWYGGYGNGGGGGGEDEGTASGYGGNGAAGFITLTFDCTNASQGAGGTAIAGAGGTTGGPSSIMPPLAFNLTANPTSASVYNANYVTFTITSTPTSGSPSYGYTFSSAGSGAASGNHTFASNGNTATVNSRVQSYTAGGYANNIYTVVVTATVSDANGFSTTKTIGVSVTRLG